MSLEYIIGIISQQPTDIAVCNGLNIMEKEIKYMDMNIEGDLSESNIVLSVGVRKFNLQIIKSGSVKKSVIDAPLITNLRINSSAPFVEILICLFKMLCECWMCVQNSYLKLCKDRYSNITQNCQTADQFSNAE